MRLTYKTHFDAAHCLKGCRGLKTKKCENVHGHRWEVEIVVTSNFDVEKEDMMVDFGTLKSIVDEFDHCDLNKKFKKAPTAERIAQTLLDSVSKAVGKAGWISVTVHESPNASIQVYG
jgi:queuosine biosynthesis protein QueD